MGAIGHLEVLSENARGGPLSPDHVMALMMFGGVALGIGLLAFLYLGGVALWFHFKHSGFALAVLTLPLALMLSPSK